MVESVQSTRFYQATTTNHYKVAFAKGQTVIVGTEHNPFFQFYEFDTRVPN